MTQQYQLSTLRDYFQLIFRRKLLVTIVFLVTAAAVIAGVSFLPPVYVAKATLIVKFGREFIYRPEVGSFRDGQAFSLEEMVNAEVEILNSRDLAAQVVGELSVERLYPRLLPDRPDPETALARAISRFRENIGVMAVVESSIIKISFKHGEPQMAAEALNLLVEKFKDKHLEIFSDPKSGFLEAQLMKYREKLVQSQSQLRYFKEKHAVYQIEEQEGFLFARRLRLDAELSGVQAQIDKLQQELDLLEETGAVGEPYFPERRKSLESEMHELNKTLRETQFTIVGLERKFALFNERKNGEEAVAAPHPGFDRFKSLDEAHIRMLDLQLQEDELLRKFNPRSRAVEALKTAAFKVATFIEDRGGYIEKLLEEQIREELQTLKAKQEAMLVQLARLRSEIDALEAQEVSLSRKAIMNQLDPLRERRNEIATETSGLEESLRTLDLRKDELVNLERDVALNYQNVQTYLDKSEDALITEELDKQKIINVGVIEQASPPASASGLSKKIKIATGLAAGLAAALAVVLFAELMRPSDPRPRD